MTTFKSFRSVYGVFILPFMVLGERDERKHVLAVQTNSELLGPNSTAWSPSHAGSAANFMQLMDRSASGAGDPRVYSQVTSGKRFLGEDEEAPYTHADPANGCNQDTFGQCAEVPGCAWMFADAFGSECVDDCAWRSHDKTTCKQQPDMACMWIEKKPPAEPECQRTARCDAEDFSIPGANGFFKDNFETHKKACTTQQITSDRCKCWHWESLNAMSTRPKQICKLCNMCKDKHKEPYHNTEDFARECIVPGNEQREAREREQAKKQNERDQIEKDRFYEQMKAAMVARHGWK